ncbi:helix-turn-helix transcriptional regulator [Streptomyces sp. NPDC059278]|uniref:helix-turn-helix transcriptional regulator n=2 Tax=unclassified Streptomyces TaxID=2593676 RepID=UPI0036C074F9
MPVAGHGLAPCEPLTPNPSPVTGRPAGKSPMEDHFGTAIRRFRLRATLTQEALAERFGVPVSTIRGMATGTRASPGSRCTGLTETLTDSPPGNSSST